jgi:hypothetical protein
LIFEDPADDGSVSIELPNASGEPLEAGGRYRIVCPDPAAPNDVDRYAKTTSFKISDSEASVQFTMDRFIPHLTFKQRVYRP